MEMMSFLADIASDIVGIAALLALLVKPIRQKLFDDKAAREGDLCLLRAEMTRLYYRHQAEKQLRQYEYENLCLCYKAYKAQGGNSFVDHIFEEMQDWTVVS